MMNDDVCEILGVSRSSLYRWKANQEAFGSVIPPRNPLQGGLQKIAGCMRDLRTLLRKLRWLLRVGCGQWLRGKYN
jgi:transposase